MLTISAATSRRFCPFPPFLIFSFYKQDTCLSFKIYFHNPDAFIDFSGLIFQVKKRGKKKKKISWQNHFWDPKNIYKIKAGLEFLILLFQKGM